MTKAFNQISFFERCYEVVLRIPYGKVTTYGAIAKYLGAVRSSRMVGWAMNNSHDKDIPSHRVVNRVGLLTGKHHFDGINLMKELLEKLDDQNLNLGDYQTMIKVLQASLQRGAIQITECETVGTRSYLSPEVKKGYYSKASDIYSLGCMLYCIYTRSNPSKIDKKIIDKKCDIELKNLILAMTEYNSYYRPTIYEINDYLT